MTLATTCATVAQWVLVVVVIVFLCYVLYTKYYTARHQRASVATDYQQPRAHSSHTTTRHHTANTAHATHTRAAKTAHALSPTPPPAARTLCYKPNDPDGAFPPVWVPVDESIAKVLQDYRPPDDPCTWANVVGEGVAALPASQVPPDFADVFRGYQRLALLSLHLAFGARHRILFVHKGNWHRLCPQLGGNNPLANRFRTLSDTMRLDYVKSHVLAHYGGYWVPPDTVIVRSDLHAYVHDDVLPQARNDPNVPYDVPLLVVSGVRQLHHGATTEWFKDDSVLFAEPQNPVLLALANQMHLALSDSAQPDYDFHQRFTKALHVYSSPTLNGERARSVVVLPPCCAGAIDADGVPVTADHYFRQRPLDHLPHPDARWFVVDTPDRRITRYPKYEWFAYLSEDAIVQSQLWVSLLYRRALQMDSGDASGNHRRSVSLHDEHHPLRLAWVRSWTAWG